MPRSAFAETLPPTERPPRRGAIEPGKGKTPLYILAWRFAPLDLLPGPSGGNPIDFHDDFVHHWADNVRAKPVEHMLQRPAVLVFFTGAGDNYVYFVAASNNEDPAKLDLSDIEYARAALPKLAPYAVGELDVEAEFKWYRRVKN
ncbi:hypothetical protein HMN09_01148200 [Mycena chlorophos]|uniref:Uncharacterized protein n=1 Tax=Mycena chlorophos TaxID=658473 RepID=A0A8H6VXV5_MYCCL|nr:hypothetical protein HMN09_01148200 [Mycena chlorophos]